MSNYDQERFEDYLEVERYIEDLRAGRKGMLPEELTLEQARVYHMAAQLRSAIPENAAPRPEFVEALGARLQAKHQAQIEGTIVPQATPPAPIAEEDTSSEAAPTLPIAPTENVPTSHRKVEPNVSRRHLLTGSAVAAASLAIGTVAGAAFERGQIPAPQKPPVSTVGNTQVNTPVNTPDWKIPLVGTNIPTRWQRVIPLAQLGNEAHSFQTGAIVGFVMLNDEQSSSGSTDPVVAFSAACTHMGCLVHWQTTQRNFYCPCHGGVFDEYGAPAKASSIRYLRSLPRLNTKVGEDGYIYVEVPLTPSQNV